MATWNIFKRVQIYKHNLQTYSTNILGAVDLEVTEASGMKALVLLPKVILIQSLMNTNLVFP